MRKTETNRFVLGMLLTACLVVLMAFAVSGFFTKTGKAAAADDGTTADTTADGATPTTTLDYVNAEEYLTGYYNGTITKDDSNVYEGPGTKAYNKVTTSTGKTVTLSKGTTVTIIGESRDADLDHWYHVTVEFDGETVSGYVWDGRVERAAQVTFTPTPSPEPTSTPEPTPTVEAETDTEESAADSTTQAMADEGGTPKIWIWLLVVILIILVIIVIYTILSKREEDRLEEEMKRYTNSNAMERLDGEAEDDWASAVKEHRKHQLVGRDKKREKAEEEEEELENADMTVDMTGIFSDDEQPQAETSDSSDYTDDIKVNEVRKSLHMEAARREQEAAAIKASWNEEDAAYVNNLTESMSDEDKALFGKLGNSLTQEAGLSQEEILRSRLDQLKEQDIVIHKLYGEGEVIDNSDAEVIQIRFGNDLRFLKKEKLAKKDLVVF